MTPPLRALIVDDERLARRELRRLLDDDPRMEPVGEAASVAEAAALLEDLQPAVVFLDVQMPGGSGFDLLPHLAPSVQVVFVTAYDAYALRAFDVNALDYLLKPVHPDRLRRTVDRLLAPAVPAPATAPFRPEDHLFLALNGRPTFLPVADIAWIAAAGDYTEVHALNGRTGLVHRTLKSWSTRLPATHFVRIHRSTIVNLTCVERVEAGPGTAFRVRIAGRDAPLAMSRRYAARLKKRMG